MSKLSILMPLLNVAPYIHRSLSSVMGQTFSDMEILCVDAGSTDGTLDVLEECAARDRRIRILRSGRKSYGFQMNLGLQEACGEYVGIVEPDDFIDPEMFERLYEAAVESRSDIVKGNYYEHWKGRDFFHETLAGHAYGQVFCPRESDAGLLEVSPSIWSAIYRREFLMSRGIRFTETAGASYQDVSFGMKALASADRVMLMKEAFLHYRKDNPNQSVKSVGKERCIFDEFDEVACFLDRQPEIAGKVLHSVMRAKYGQFLTNLHRLDAALVPGFLLDVKRELEVDARKGFFSPDAWPWGVDIFWRQVLSGSEGDVLRLAFLLEQRNRMYVEGFWRELGERRESALYLYGAGRVGFFVRTCMEANGFRLSGVLVTQSNGAEEWDGIPLLEADSFVGAQDDCTVLVAVGDEKLQEILPLLQGMGFRHVIAMHLELRKLLHAE